MTPSLAMQPVIVPIESGSERAGPPQSGFADAVSSSVGRWVIEPIVEPDGERGYIIMPASGNDADGPTFAIWEVGSSFRIDETRWDSYRTVAQCLTLADVLTEIERRTGIQSWGHIN
jgi:hypothetical protein